MKLTLITLGPMAEMSEHHPDRPAVWTMPDWAALAVAGGVLAVAWGIFGAAVKPHLAWGLLIVLGSVVMAVGFFTGWRRSRPASAMRRSMAILSA